MIFSSFVEKTGLTDADKNNGVTELIKGSHSSKKSSYDSSDIIALNSTKGTVFLFDGSTLHKGNEKIDKYRIATFVRFGKRENYASVLDGGISDPLYYNCWIIIRKRVINTNLWNLLTDQK